MAGPCSVESEEQLLSTAHSSRREVHAILRGGATNPDLSLRVSGPCKEGLRLWNSPKGNRLKIVTEVLSERDVSVVAETADILKSGPATPRTFNMIECARSKKPFF